MAATVYGDISPRTAAFVVKQLLERGMPYMVLEKFGQAKPLPSNSTKSMKWRRYSALALATTPLSEGVAPTSTKLSSVDVTLTLAQYGEVVELTDIVLDTHEDPILQETISILGEQASQTVETIRFNALKAGSNVVLSNGTLRTDVNTPISLAKIRAVIRALRAQYAKPITSIIKSTPNFNTENVLPSYVAVAHTDLESDIRSLNGFQDVKDYGSVSPWEGEIGSVEGLRFILSPIYTAWANGGGAKAGSGTTMVSTAGTSADVYPILIFGRDAYATVALKGKFAVIPMVVNPTPAFGNPLGQLGSVGWKTMQGAVILNDAWMCRLEVAATAL
jgi:N4-gp56 family major capsid protein